MKEPLPKGRTRKPKQLIGMTDIVDFPELDLFGVKAKIDTGAYTSALHCKDVRVVESGEQTRLSFYILQSAVGQEDSVVKTETSADPSAVKRFYSDNFTQRLIRNSFGVVETRYVIKTRIILFGRVIKAEFTLADRERMKNPVLLGRKLLRNRFIVDVSQQNLSYQLKNSETSPADPAPEQAEDRG